MIYHMLSAVNISLAVKQGRQEDAEEFLSCLLNGLHEEMLAVMGSVKDKCAGKLIKVPYTPVHLVESVKIVTCTLGCGINGEGFNSKLAMVKMCSS